MSQPRTTQTPHDEDRYRGVRLWSRVRSAKMRGLRGEYIAEKWRWWRSDEPDAFSSPPLEDRQHMPLDIDLDELHFTAVQSTAVDLAMCPPTRACSRWTSATAAWAS